MTTPQTSLRAGPFPETSWSLIHLCRGEDAALGKAGLETLFRGYWGPVFGYIRRAWSRDVEEAKDLTQAFFLAFLEKDFLSAVEAEKGRFRSFVLAALKHFLANQKRHEKARKRSPEGGFLSLDRVVVEPAAPADLDGGDADLRFDEDWRRAVLDAVLVRLKEIALRAGKAVAVDLFVEYDLAAEDRGRVTYDDLGAKFGLSAHQVKNHLYWVRKEFMAVLSREIEDQVSSPADRETEIKNLFGGGGASAAK